MRFARVESPASVLPVCRSQADLDAIRGRGSGRSEAREGHGTTPQMYKSDDWEEYGGLYLMYVIGMI